MPGEVRIGVQMDGAAQAAGQFRQLSDAAGRLQAAQMAHAGIVRSTWSPAMAKAAKDTDSAGEAARKFDHTLATMRGWVGGMAITTAMQTIRGLWRDINAEVREYNRVVAERGLDLPKTNVLNALADYYGGGTALDGMPIVQDPEVRKREIEGRRQAAVARLVVADESPEAAVRQRLLESGRSSVGQDEFTRLVKAEEQARAAAEKRRDDAERKYAEAQSRIAGLMADMEKAPRPGESEFDTRLRVLQQQYQRDMRALKTVHAPGAAEARHALTRQYAAEQAKVDEDRAAEVGRQLDDFFGPLDARAAQVDEKQRAARQSAVTASLARFFGPLDDADPTVQATADRRAAVADRIRAVLPDLDERTANLRGRAMMSTRELLGEERDRKRDERRAAREDARLEKRAARADEKLAHGERLTRRDQAALDWRRSRALGDAARNPNAEIERILAAILKALDLEARVGD